MEWEESALKGMEKVPFFVRKMAKKKVEEYARRHGCERITLEEVQRARQEMMGGEAPGNGHQPSAQAAAVEAPSEDSQELREGATAIPMGEIRRIERAMAVNALGHDKTHYCIKLCGGAAGCPMARIDVKAIGDKIAREIEEKGLPEVIASRINGPVLTHHKFRVAVAGCPNACSEPQTKDFGIIGRSRPGITEEPCIECMTCEQACREDAIHVLNGGPQINYDLCVNCGMCIEACPTGTLAEDLNGESILVGGRLGRHPKLAETVADIADDDAIIRALDVCIDLIKTEGTKVERFGALLERTGTGRIRESI